MTMVRVPVKLRNKLLFQTRVALFWQGRYFEVSQRDYVALHCAACASESRLLTRAHLLRGGVSQIGVAVDDADATSMRSLVPRIATLGSSAPVM